MLDVMRGDAMAMRGWVPFKAVFVCAMAAIVSFAAHLYKTGSNT